MMKTKIVILFFVLSFIVNAALIIFLLSDYYRKKTEVKSPLSYNELNRYKTLNKDLQTVADKGRVVFIGNSIVQYWSDVCNDFFLTNNYIGRGIGGQTSTQILLRFQSDVVSIQPQIVVILAGANDIAEGDGYYDIDYTLSNIKSMIDIAQHNKIKVILCSVLPAREYKLFPMKTISGTAPKIDILNSKLESLANDTGVTYVDFNIAMRDEKGAMIDDMTLDGVHPNGNGYLVMQSIIKPVIDAILYLQN